ncbi:MAG: undecaprenyl-diphosphate phosphatase [Actinobacteria bacterium]|nr:undecaprenyl-diphosphate phosphatase [Actinomycetota bacterium]
MPIIHAIVLGITQGLSEFLPISSSGHLILVPWLFHWHDFANNESLNKAFDVALHMGTFVGAVAYFRKDLWAYLRAGLRSIGHRSIETTDERLAWLLLLSAVPGAIAGALGESVIDDHLGKPVLIAIMLIVFGAVLYWADRLPGRRDVGEFRFREAAWMGLAQAAALQPGVSRSGVTITAGRVLGFDRDAAARISFLMSIPIIGGAGLYKGAKLMANGGIPHGSGPAFLWGILASGLTGFIAIWGLLRIVRTRSFTPFVLYRFAAGAFILVVAGLRA